MSLAAPASSSAYGQTYCGELMWPGVSLCNSSGLHSWRWNRANYPGPPQHNILVCEYVWNAEGNRVRGNGPYCGTNNVETDYGATTRAVYNARVYLHPSVCCQHTVVGYARTE